MGRRQESCRSALLLFVVAQNGSLVILQQSLFFYPMFFIKL
jgi:hypothetical protein